MATPRLPRGYSVEAESRRRRGCRGGRRAGEGARALERRSTDSVGLRRGRDAVIPWRHESRRRRGRSAPVRTAPDRERPPWPPRGRSASIWPQSGRRCFGNIVGADNTGRAPTSRRRSTRGAASTRRCSGRRRRARGRGARSGAGRASASSRRGSATRRSGGSTRDSRGDGAEAS